MLGSLICLAIAQSSAIDLETRAARLPVFLAELSKMVGEPLECAPNVAGQVVLVRFKGVEKGEALSRIASVVDGEWQTMKGVKVLTRTSARQRALEVEWRRRQSEWIKEAMKPGQKALEEDPKFEGSTARALLREIAANEQQGADPSTWDLDRTAKIYALHSRGPEGRAMTRLLQQLGPDAIATIPVGRTVYTLQPNRFQRQLPKSTMDIVRVLRSELDIWGQELDANPIPVGGDGYLSTDPRMSSMGRVGIENVLLIAHRHNPRSNISFEFAGYGADGNAVFSANANLIPGFHFANSEQVQKLRTSAGDTDLSPVSKRLLALANLDYVRNDRAEPELAAIVRDPVKSDPLSYAPSELLLAYAAQRNRHLVASLTDNLEIPTSASGNLGRINVSAFVSLNVLQSNIEVEDSAGWITIKPSSKAGEPLLPDNRFASRDLFASALAIGYFTIDALAEFAGKSTGDWNALGFNMARMLLPRTERILQDADWAALRIYAGLSSSQRDGLTGGKTVPVAELSSRAKDVLLSTIIRQGFQSYDNGLFLAAMRLNSSPEKWDYEPTNLFRSGLLGGEISARPDAKSDLMIGTANSKYVAWTHFASPEALGQQLRKGSEIYSLDCDLWTGSTRTLDLRIDFGMQLALKLRLMERQYDLRKPPTKLKDLPADIQRRIGGS